MNTWIWTVPLNPTNIISNSDILGQYVFAVGALPYKWTQNVPLTLNGVTFHK